jgi:UDP-glucuronate 4-epimerase
LTIFVKAVERGETIQLYGDGSVRRDFTHVTDICDGLFTALTAEGAVGETINLGHHDPIEMRRLIALIEKLAGKPAQIDFRPPRAEDLPVTNADLSKARRLLGYQPSVPLEEGLRDYIGWFRSWHQDAPA